MTDSTFSELIAEVSNQEIRDLKAHGIDLHLTDVEGRSIIEKPDGRRFEIEYLALGGYHVLRELEPLAA